MFNGALSPNKVVLGLMEIKITPLGRGLVYKDITLLKCNVKYKRKTHCKEIVGL